MLTYLIDYFMEGYQSFTIDKSMMKRLYSVEKEPYQKFDDKQEEVDKDKDKKVDDEQEGRRSDKEEFLYRIRNRQSYSFGYCSYIWTSLLIKMFSCCCCCRCCK